MNGPGFYGLPVNPQKMTHVFILAASATVRAAALRMEYYLGCKVEILNGPAQLNAKLQDMSFVLFVDEAAMHFMAISGHDPNCTGLLSYRPA